MEDRTIIGRGIIFFNKKTRIFLAFCGIRGLDPRVVDSLLKMANAPWRDLQFGYTFNGESLISRARSVVATSFLEHDQGNILLFVDDDIIFSPADVYQIAQDVNQHQTIVCAPYQVRSTTDVRLACTPMTNDPIIVGPGGGIREVRYASSGFMAIPKKVLEDVAATLPRLDTGHGYTKDGEIRVPMYPFFAPTWPDGVYLSEDYSMVHRCRELGYKVYIDSTIVLRHIGTAEFFEGKAH